MVSEIGRAAAGETLVDGDNSHPTTGAEERDKEADHPLPPGERAGRRKRKVRRQVGFEKMIGKGGGTRDLNPDSFLHIS